jgi:hypothetical protein
MDGLRAHGTGVESTRMRQKRQVWLVNGESRGTSSSEASCRVTCRYNDPEAGALRIGKMAGPV